MIIITHKSYLCKNIFFFWFLLHFLRFLFFIKVHYNFWYFLYFLYFLRFLEHFILVKLVIDFYFFYFYILIFINFSDLFNFYWFINVFLFEFILNRRFNTKVLLYFIFDQWFVNIFLLKFILNLNFWFLIEVYFSDFLNFCRLLNNLIIKMINNFLLLFLFRNSGINLSDIFIFVNQFLQFLISFLFLFLALFYILIKLLISFFHFIHVLIIAMNSRFDCNFLYFFQFSHEQFVKMLHHQLEFAKKRSLIDQMSDIIKNLYHQTVNFIVFIQYSRSWSMLRFINHKQFLSSLQISHFQILMKSHWFIHLSYYYNFQQNPYRCITLQFKSLISFQISSQIVNMSFQQEFPRVEYLQQNSYMIQLEPTKTKKIDLRKDLISESSPYKSRQSNIQQDGIIKKENRQQPTKLVKITIKKRILHPYQYPVEVISDTSYLQQQPQQFKQMSDKRTDFVFKDYQVMDLTYSLINAKIDVRILAILFFIQIIVRYFSIVSLIYLMVETSTKYWEWIIVLLFTNTIYFICIVKTSIKFPQTTSENILKKAFNSLQQNQNEEYFQVIDSKKLGKSILRGLIPPELSFLYIKQMNSNQNHLHIYAMINYIYNSIQAVIYYPYFVIYTAQIYIRYDDPPFGWIFFISYASIIFSEILFIILGLYLLVHGCKKKGYILSKKQS